MVAIANLATVAKATTVQASGRSRSARAAAVPSVTPRRLTATTGIIAAASRSSFMGTPAMSVRPQGVSRGRTSVVTEAGVKEIFMPALSSTMTEGKIVSWLKAEGDTVGKGEAVVVVESDKADMDVESFHEGILAGISIGDGESAAVGEAIAYIAETEADVAEAQAKAAGGGAAPAAAAPPPPPPPPPPPAAEAAPAAAAPAAAAPAPPPPPPPPAPAAAAPAAPARAPRADGRVIATPYAKKLASKLRVDLATIGGSGPNGRITASDVEAAAGAPPAAAAAPAAAAPAPAAAPAAAAPAPAAPAPAAAAPAPAAPAPAGSEPLNSMQLAVSKNMLDSLAVPEFRVSYTITTDAFDALYKKLKPKGVTMSALLAKAIGVALAKHPIINANCVGPGVGSAINYNDNVNIAMAVAMPDGGLITPVLKNADSTDIYQMSRDWADLVKRAREKKLSPDEFTTGTFTISNLGMFGVDSFDAVLPPGTGAIIAIGASKPQMVAQDDGSFKVAKQMKVNLTADHRHIYGADAAAFLKDLAAVIESPENLVF